MISWHSIRIPILTFNQRYNIGTVEVMSTINLVTSIWLSGETSLNKTLGHTLETKEKGGTQSPLVRLFFPAIIFFLDKKKLKKNNRGEIIIVMSCPSNWKF